uniref:Uncharacterized protein n=1 Tax=Amorphochlora amoebiformis TaxID=1561963 RepID=A0A7S0H3T9_9EUKA|mmetsp:Transcript_27381/g.43461  ORF Transcript_27381/g.43461 Transcript_27381/m.43461 type:complete len:649 (+) Transcript_27381:1757-3703(+)
MKEAKDIFERISEKKLALLWVNHHISRSARKTRQGQDFDKKELKKRRDSMLAKSSKLNKTRIKEEEKSVQGERNTTNTHVWNFTTDFQDCEVLGRLLQVIVPHAANKRLIESADLLQRTTRIKEVLNAIGRLRTRRDSEFGRKKSEKESKVGLGDFIKAEDLINGQSGDKICILCLRLLADYPGMEVDTKQLRRGIEVEINKWMALIHELVDQRIMVVEKMNRLRDLNEKVISSFFSISMLIDDLRLRHKFWVEVLQPRAQKASLAFLARLARGENIKTEGDCLGNDRMEDDTKHFRKAMGDSRHVEPVLALQSFLSVSTANVMHYPEHERKSTISRQMLETQEVLKKHYTELRRVYKYFAQQDQSEIKNAAAATCMNITEFWSLVKDCGLLKLFKLREQDKKSRMRSSLLVKLFRHIAQACSEELKGPGGLAPTPKPTVSFDRMKSDISPEEIHSDLVLNLKSFLRLLIALVIQCAGGRIHQLAFYLDKFITLKILPSCKFIDNQSFRTHLQNLEVFQLFHKHRKYLLRVFYTYSISKSVGYDLKDSVRHEIWKETMDFEEFYEMCENSLIVDEKLCQRQLYYIFTSAQEEEASLKTCPSLTYPEFLDTLSAIAIYKRPLPFDTMLTRVDQFLRLDFVPWIRRTLVM